MCIYRYIYIYIYIEIYTYTYIIHTHVYVCMHIYIYIYIPGARAIQERRGRHREVDVLRLDRLEGLHADAQGGQAHRPHARRALAEQPREPAIERCQRVAVGGRASRARERVRRPRVRVALTGERRLLVRRVGLQQGGELAAQLAQQPHKFGRPARPRVLQAQVPRRPEGLEVPGRGLREEALQVQQLHGRDGRDGLARSTSLIPGVG